MKLSSLQVDEKLSQEGRVFEFGQPDEDGTQAWFKIGYAEQSRSKVNKLTKEAMAKLPMGKTLKEKVMEEINRKAMCGTVLIDFGGIQGDDGKPLEVNEANMLAILKTPACYAFITTKAVELANFQIGKEEQAKAETKSGAGLESGMGGSPGLSDPVAGRGDAGSSTGTPAEPAELAG